MSMSTLYVMLNGLKEMMGVAAWGKGIMRVAFGQDNPLDCVFLMVSKERDGVKPRGAALVFDLLPWRGLHVNAEGVTVAVHSFRYESPLGQVRFLSFCQCCGTTRMLEAQELAEVGSRECDKCGAPVTHESCHRWHNWGGCVSCPGAKGTVFAGRSVEDHRPQKAGPDAPSLGSAVQPGREAGWSRRVSVFDVTDQERDAWHADDAVHGVPPMPTDAERELDVGPTGSAPLACGGGLDTSG